MPRRRRLDSNLRAWNNRGRMNYHGIDISDADIKALCRKWQIQELALFGSVLRDDFGPNSDVDVLVTFDVAAGWSL